MIRKVRKKPVGGSRSVLLTYLVLNLLHFVQILNPSKVGDAVVNLSSEAWIMRQPKAADLQEELLSKTSFGSDYARVDKEGGFFLIQFKP